MAPEKLVAAFRDKALHKAAQAYVLLVSSFVAVLLLTNVITAKYFTLGRSMLTAGAITYPFTFSLLDIIAEIYGQKKAQLTVWMGFIASIFMTILLQIANCIPAYAQSPVDQKTFQRVFGFTPGIVFGSMVAYLIAQLIDIYLFELGRRWTQGKYLWLRNNVSTLTSQLIDTLVFGLIAWIVWPMFGISQGITPIAWATWYQIMLSEYTFKVGFTVLNTPLVYLGVAALKRWAHCQTIFP